MCVGVYVCKTWMGGRGCVNVYVYMWSVMRKRLAAQGDDGCSGDFNNAVEYP